VCSAHFRQTNTFADSWIFPQLLADAGLDICNNLPEYDIALAVARNSQLAVAGMSGLVASSELSQLEVSSNM
jgi:hypothetical protein